MKLKRFTIQLAAAGLIAVPLMANAAGLGKLSVTSALGQPLAAEIEVFAADKAELDSLTANLASDQAFRDARVDYAPVLSALRFSVERKPDGRAVLKVTSSRPINDPFVDMLIELNWASGRLVREYTMLLDPPGMVAPQTVAPVAAVTPARAPAAAPAPAPAPAPVTAAPAAAAAEPKPAAAREPAPAAQAAAPDSVTVKPGDTLTGIASRVRPEGVSLEQTLLGLYRENSRAFDGNMNRLKAGKTLNIPSAEAVAAIPKAEAVRELKLQADDWRAYRQKLAAAVSAAPEAEAAPGQAVSGKITPKVEDRAKPAPEAQKDVLKLSKATAAAAAAKADEVRALQEKLRAQEEDATAREKALQESGQRIAMLEKQIQDMQQLVDMKEKAAAEAAASKPAAPAPAAEAPVPAPAADAPAPAPKPVAPVIKTPKAAPVESTDGFGTLLENPMYWGGGLAALGLGGVLWWMMAGGGRRRKTATSTLEDSIMSGGDVRPNTVMPAASGGSVNTGDTSFLTDFSQAGLGTIDTHDVDPIAEAEVYMAYGRDAQAEEILKEAISKNPDRHEIRVKLLEIYAARRNTAAFESVAGELYAALGSKPSPLWDKACEMGRSIDPTNPLYGGEKSGAAAAAAAATVTATTAVAGGAVAFGEESAREEAPAAPETVARAAFESEPQPEPVAASAPLEFETAGHVLNFETQAPAAAAAAPESGYVELDTQGLGFDMTDLDLAATADDELKLDLGLDEDNGPDSKFDFSGLDLDLGTSGDNELELDEVGTKLDLARAYVEMGDKEGAREILNEVLSEGNDTQKSDAKGMLSALG
jgi:pilus assembly protein FimV